MQRILPILLNIFVVLYLLYGERLKTLLSDLSQLAALLSSVHERGELISLGCQLPPKLRFSDWTCQKRCLHWDGHGMTAGRCITAGLHLLKGHEQLAVASRI